MYLWRAEPSGDVTVRPRRSLIGSYITPVAVTRVTALLGIVSVEVEFAAMWIMHVQKESGFSRHKDRLYFKLKYFRRTSVGHVNGHSTHVAHTI